VSSAYTCGVCVYRTLRYLCDLAVIVCMCVLTGVYTRNRNFRLLMSTKLGKTSGELKVARENQFLRKSAMGDSLPGKRTQRLQQRTENDLALTFLDSLICNVAYVPSCCWFGCSSEFCFFVYSAWQRLFFCTPSLLAFACLSLVHSSCNLIWLHCTA